MIAAYHPQGRAEQVCQQGATWQPFVVKASFAQQGPPIVVAVSNNTWCQTRSQQTTAATIASNAADLRTNTKLFKVKNEAGTQLLLLNAQRAVSGGGELFSNDKKGELSNVACVVMTGPVPVLCFPCVVAGA